MTTIGDLLLLKATYDESTHQYPHTITASLNSETKKVLSDIVAKLNNYTDTKCSMSSLVRLLIHYSIDSLEFSKLLEQEDPLAVLPKNSAPRIRLSDLGQMSDVVNLPAKELTRNTDMRKGNILWK